MSLTRSPLYAYANSVGYDNIGPVNIVCTICKDCFYSKYSRFRFVAAVLKLQSLRLPWWFIDANTSAIQVPGYENAGPRGENEIDFEVQITMRTTAWPNVLIGNVARVPGRCCSNKPPRKPQTLQQYSGTMRTYAGPRGENRNRSLKITMRTLGHAVKIEIDFVLILISFHFDFDFDLFWLWFRLTLILISLCFDFDFALFWFWFRFRLTLNLISIDFDFVFDLFWFRFILILISIAVAFEINLLTYFPVSLINLYTNSLWECWATILICSDILRTQRASAPELLRWKRQVGDVAGDETLTSRYHRLVRLRSALSSPITYTHKTKQWLLSIHIIWSHICFLTNTHTVGKYL